MLNLALQKVGSDSFDFDGDLVLTADRSRLVYCLTDLECVSVPEGVTVIGEMAFKQKKKLAGSDYPGYSQGDREGRVL